MTKPFESAPLRFDDGKSPEAMRTIGEVARVLGIRQHVLRYWEAQFPMLEPVKRSGGRRYYRPEDIALIARIDQLVHREGFTLRGARRAIETGQIETAPVSAKTARSEAGNSPAVALAAEDIVSLTHIRNRLARALEVDAAG